MTSRTIPPYRKMNLRLAGDRHPETGVVFDQRGFPIFDTFARFDTRFTTGEFRNASYTQQMAMATRALRSQMENNPQLRAQFTPDQQSAIRQGKAKIPKLTWHHHQDSGRMQLIDSSIHSETGHIGGQSMNRGR